MKDFLGNDVKVGDTVLIAIKSGKYAVLGRGYVKQEAFKAQFAGGAPTNMLEIEWSNINRFWLPARNVVAIPDEMLPEKRRERLNNVQEGVQVS